MPFSFRRLFERESYETVSNALHSVQQHSKDLSDALHSVQQQLNILTDQVDQAKMLAAQSILLELRKQNEAIPLRQTEFRVFSQFGDDGIIQYIITKLSLPAAEQRFVEFGAENYRESNTRFLLLNNNWSGLVMDGSEAYVSSIHQDSFYWKYDLTALARFITRENIDSILHDAGFQGRIGILSIDVDGNDYWIWEAITVVDPAVVIVEYNGLFGGHEPVTIPYQADFTRENAHYSLLYWGTSLQALCQLAARKNYVWIGCNSSGNNAYFVRRADSNPFHLPSLPSDFVAAKFREGRDMEGNLAYIGQQEGFALIKDLPVWDVVTNRTRLISDLVR
jgi:hypothetical protein